MAKKKKQSNRSRSTDGNSTGKASKKPLAGQTFLFVGRLRSCRREKAVSLVQSQGGQVSPSPHSEVNYLVAGIKPGEYTAVEEEALALNGTGEALIQWISEKQFQSLVGHT